MSDSETASDDQDDDIKEDDQSSIRVFDNKLARLILHQEWRKVEHHLRTEAGKTEASAAVFSTTHGEWVPLHVLYLPYGMLPRTLRAYTSPFLVSHLSVPLSTINALLELNPGALLRPNSAGTLVALNAMQASACPKIIQSMVDSQPSMLMMRLAPRRKFFERGNMLIHDMIRKLKAVDLDLFMAYTKIVVDKSPDCILEKDGSGITVALRVLNRIRQPREQAVFEYIFESHPELGSIPHDQFIPRMLPIHHACIVQDCPCSVIDRLIRLRPEALSQRMGGMDLPLHLFSARRDVSSGYNVSLEKMIKANPQSVLELSFDGCMPLHIHTGTLITMLKARESNAALAEKFRAHLILLNDTYVKTLDQVYEMHDSERKNADEQVSSLQKVAWLSHLFMPIEVTELLLLTELVNLADDSEKRLLFQRDEFGNTFLHLFWNTIGKNASIQRHWKTKLDTDEEWRAVLHENSGDCRHDLDARIRLYDSDEDISESGDNGAPLLTTLTAAFDLIGKYDVSTEDIQALLQTSNQKREMPLHRVLRFGRTNKYTVREVNQLIELYPEASQRANINGELPLHIALKFQCPSKLYSYVAPLLAANAAAASSIDPVEKLAPFMLAAVGREAHGNKTGLYTSCLDSTYALLRTDPSMLG